MPLKDDEQRRILQYLLGESQAQDRDAIEQRFILNDRFFDEVQALEDRLIADYLGERLSDRERQLFEDNFLASPRRRRKVETQRGMQSFFSQARSADSETAGSSSPAIEHAASPSPIAPGQRFAWLAAALILSLGLGYYTVTQRGEIQTLRDQLARKEHSPPAAETAVQFAEVVLNPGIERSGGAGANMVTVSASSQLIRLRLRLPASNAYATYTAGIELPDGSLLSKQYRLKPQSAAPEAFVDLVIPSSVVPSGDYVATLVGVAASGKVDPQPSYLFRVE